MDTGLFNSKQKDIYINLLKEFESEPQLQTWLSLPNKLFRNRAPIDVLLSQNYDYFDRFLETSNIE